MGGHVDFRLLGEIEVRAAGRRLDVGTPRQQVVLAALAVDARRPVTMDALIDRVWGHDPPANPRPVLYAHLSRIRGLLKQAAVPGSGTAARIERRHAGYVLDVDPELVDLHRFRRLVGQGDDRRCDDRHCDDPRCDDEVRAATLAEALGLWRGEPLAGLSGDWAAQVRESCRQRRLDALVRWARAECRLGRPTGVISALPDLTAEYPLAEPLEHVLIQALHAAGREAEALERYGAVRRRLAEELGAGPGKELRTLYQSVLIGDRPRPPAAVHRPADPPPVSGGSPVGPPAGPLPGDGPSTAGADGGPSDRGAAPGPGSGSVHAGAAPARRPRVRTPHRRSLLAVLAAVVLLTASGAAYALRRDDCDRDGTAGAAEPTVERARELFAAAEAFDEQDRAGDARAAVVDAVRLWQDLIGPDPDRNAPPLAPAVLRALGRAGVDFSVSRSELLGWLGNPVHTPYPAIAQVVLGRGWRFTAPVLLDAVVWNYEHTPGVPSPRSAADVRPAVLEAALLEHTRTRHGTAVARFDQLLRP
ncbi:BTAD domain-containing putative transcriptional regulator [Kitasatospora sp. NPDC056327]|uniref:BTAD domain-containing putative transcriptional regulator n=1 Tax=Kitasatospora sp. NPDC056327 TaxID=3345785 RepID=UPI0035E1B5C9